MTFICPFLADDIDKHPNGLKSNDMVIMELPEEIGFINFYENFGIDESFLKNTVRTSVNGLIFKVEQIFKARNCNEQYFVVITLQSKDSIMVQSPDPGKSTVKEIELYWRNQFIQDINTIMLFKKDQIACLKLIDNKEKTNV